MSKQAIICVDDEPVVLLSLQDQLKHNLGDKYVYEFAESADEALEVIEDLDAASTDIVIIVSDWLMPQMKGDEFLIKVHEKFPKAVKMLLTGQADTEAVERTRKYANLHSYIPKPWDEQTLITAIESGLSLLTE